MPNLIPVLALLMANSYRLKKKFGRCRPVIWRLNEGNWEDLNVHGKQSYSGRSVIYCHEKSKTYEDLQLKKYLALASYERFCFSAWHF